MLPRHSHAVSLLGAGLLPQLLLALLIAAPLGEP
jgi:hypothetical protein